MDISSATSATAVLSETNNSSQVQKTSDNSFQDEMNKVSSETTQENAKTDEVKDENEISKAEKTKVENKNAKTEEVKDEKTSETNEDNLSKSKNANSDKNNLTKDLCDTNINNEQQAVALSAEYNEYSSQNEILGINGNINSIQALLDANKQIETITQTAQTPTKIDYTTMQMNSDDAQFFNDLVKDTDATLQNVMTTLQNGTQAEVQETAQKVKVSATLMNTLSEATKTNQPFRINFDNDVSVIIKVDRDGALSAKFIPGDQAVEEYLKQNISSLRQKFDEEELSYKDLSYSQQQRQQQRRNNKEKSNE